MPLCRAGWLYLPTEQRHKERASGQAVKLPSVRLPICHVPLSPVSDLDREDEGRNYSPRQLADLGLLCAHTSHSIVTLCDSKGPHPGQSDLGGACEMGECALWEEEGSVLCRTPASGAQVASKFVNVRSGLVGEWLRRVKVMGLAATQPVWGQATCFTTRNTLPVSHPNL